MFWLLFDLLGLLQYWVVFMCQLSAAWCETVAVTLGRNEATAHKEKTTNYRDDGEWKSLAVVRLFLGGENYCSIRKFVRGSIHVNDSVDGGVGRHRVSWGYQLSMSSRTSFSFSRAISTAPRAILRWCTVQYISRPIGLLYSFSSDMKILTVVNFSALWYDIRRRKGSGHSCITSLMSRIKTSAFCENSPTENWPRI